MHCTHGGSGEKIVRIRRVLWLAISFPHRTLLLASCTPQCTLGKPKKCTAPCWRTEQLAQCTMHVAQCTIQNVAHWDTCAPCWTVGRLHLHFVTSLSGQPERQEQAFDTSWLSNVSLSRQTHIKLIVGCDPSIIGAKQKQTPTCMRTFSRAVAQNGSIHRLRLRLLPHLLHRGPRLSLSGNENPSKVSSRRWDKSPWSVSETENWKPSSFEKKKLRQTWWEALGARPTHQSPVSVASHQKKSLGPKVIKSDVGPREVDFGYMRTTTSCGQLGCEFQPVALVGQPLPTIGGAAGARKVSWGQPKSPSALTPLPSLTS